MADMFKWTKKGKKKRGSSLDISTQGQSCDSGRGQNGAPSQANQREVSEESIPQAKPGIRGAITVGIGGETNAVFRVTVPSGVRPGQEFQVYAGHRIVRVRCPNDSKSGQSLQITVPIEQDDSSVGPGQGPKSGGAGNSLPDSSNVRRMDGQAGPDGRAAYMVTIPPGVRGSLQFPVNIAGQQLMVTCPPNVRPGMAVRIMPPTPPAETQQGVSLDRVPPGPRGRGTRSKPNKIKPPQDTQMFEVIVPKGVQPGQPFALLASGVRVLVTCPGNASSGQKIRFNLPTQLLMKKDTEMSNAAKVKMSYDKDGWTRTVRVTDLRFQWVRLADNGDVDNSTRFHYDRSAYVRYLIFREGVDPRIRTGILSLVPANDPRAVVESHIKGVNGSDLITYSDIAGAQVKTFDEKVKWFQDTCEDLRVDWKEGHMCMNVRREYLLSDSIEAVMSLSRKDLRKVWRFEFIGEMGIDAGGLAREWFQLVTEEIFDPDKGLWQSSATNQMCMTINAASGEYFCVDY